MPNQVHAELCGAFGEFISTGTRLDTTGQEVGSQIKSAGADRVRNPTAAVDRILKLDSLLSTQRRRETRSAGISPSNRIPSVIEERRVFRARFL